MSIQIPSEDQCSSPDATPLNPVFCLKKRENMKELEAREECFILEFDPDQDIHVSSHKPTHFVNYNGPFASDDVSVLSEKGQLACRDYPHPRHVCLKYPFEKSSHEDCCNLCYCYVCDVSAPCTNWTGTSGHCHAFDNQVWKMQRIMKLGNCRDKYW